MRGRCRGREAALVTCFLSLLLLLAGLVLDGAKQGEDNAGLGVDSDRSDDTFARPLHDMRPREEHGVAVRPLLDLIGLAGKGRLVDFEIVALQYDAVGWQ